MRALAGFITAGLWQAVLFVALTTALSMILPPLAPFLVYAGASALALYSLHNRAASSVVLLLAALSVLALPIGVFLRPDVALFMAGFLLLIWGPVWLVSVLLRVTRSAAMSMLVITVLTMLGLLLVFLFYGDPAQWLPVHARAQYDEIVATAPELRQQAEAGLKFIEDFAPLLTGAVAASISLNALAILAIGRWWQSVLVGNPKALRREFYGLRLNRVISLLGIAILVVAVLNLGAVSALALQWSQIISVPFIFVGLAAAHASIANLKVSSGWLIPVYLLVIFASKLIVIFGLLDPWLDLRRKTEKAEIS